MEKMESFGTMMKLDGSNWQVWKSKMEDILYCKDLHDPIEGDEAKPEKMTDKEWEKQHRKAIGYIRMWIDVSVFHHVSSETNAKSLWKKLEDLYEQKTAGNKAFIMRRLVNLKFKEGSSIAGHLNEFKSLINQLATMKMTLDDELQALLLLGSLPDSWETLVVTVSNAAPDGVLSMNMVTSSLFNEETRRKSTSTDNSQALVTENRGRSRYRDQSRGRGASKGRSKSKGRGCFHCGKPGHIKKNCWAWKKEQAGNKDEKKDENKKADSDTTAILSETDVILIFREEDCMHVTSQNSEWIVDTGATCHATSNRDLFTSYKAGDFGNVKMGNTSYSKIVGLGDIHLQTDTGCTLVLKDVRHVLNLRLNLISGITLDRMGYDIQFGGGKCKITKGSLVVARGNICCNLYKTQAKAFYDSLSVAQDRDSLSLWHRRLGHMSEKGLQVLAKKSLIPFAKGSSLTPCDYCLFGKQHRVSFSKPSKRKDNILDLIYSDVCGPIEVESLGGNKYFVTFIDDASRKMWVFMLRIKDQVFLVFQ